MIPHPEDIPGVAVTDLGRTPRTLIWCFRVIASTPACEARLKTGLGAIMPPKRAAFASVVLQRLYHSLELHSCRPIAVCGPPKRSVSWDEAALLALIAAAASDFEEIGLWMRRLGVSHPCEATRINLATISALIHESDPSFAADVAQMNRRVTPHPEPEIAHHHRAGANEAEHVRPQH